MMCCICIIWLLFHVGFVFLYNETSLCPFLKKDGTGFQSNIFYYLVFFRKWRKHLKVLFFWVFSWKMFLQKGWMNQFSMFSRTVSQANNWHQNLCIPLLRHLFRTRFKIPWSSARCLSEADPQLFLFYVSFTPAAFHDSLYCSYCL